MALASGYSEVPTGAWSECQIPSVLPTEVPCVGSQELLVGGRLRAALVRLYRRGGSTPSHCSPCHLPRELSTHAVMGGRQAQIVWAVIWGDDCPTRALGDTYWSRPDYHSWIG